MKESTYKLYAGDWIDRLWPALEAAAGNDLESLPRYLPEPAAGEWRRAVQVLHDFATEDATILRRLFLLDPTE